MISLPTPLSPVIRTLASERAAWSTSSSTARMAALIPIMLTAVFIVVLNFGHDLEDIREYAYPAGCAHSMRVRAKGFGWTL